MNATKEEDIPSEGIIISQTRVWLFGGSVDGVVIMFPIYLIGTVINSFQVDFEMIIYPLNDIVTIYTYKYIFFLRLSRISSSLEQD